MGDENLQDHSNADEPTASHPASDYETPGANPVNESNDSSESSDVETVLETPGGTTVSETPVNEESSAGTSESAS